MTLEERQKLEDRKLDWTILPSDMKVGHITVQDRYTYDLFNIFNKEALCYGERDYGINLRWCDPGKSDNVRFETESGRNAPIKFEEPVAINIRGGGWLIYSEADRWGINLTWSTKPDRQWKIVGGKAGEPVLTGTKIGLFHCTETNDFLFYDPRSYGINLKWWRDVGKFNDGILGVAKRGLEKVSVGDIIEIAEVVSGVHIPKLQK